MREDCRILITNFHCDLLKNNLNAIFKLSVSGLKSKTMHILVLQRLTSQKQLPKQQIVHIMYWTPVVNCPNRNIAHTLPWDLTVNYLKSTSCHVIDGLHLKSTFCHEAPFYQLLTDIKGKLNQKVNWIQSNKMKNK